MYGSRKSKKMISLTNELLTNNCNNIILTNEILTNEILTNNCNNIIPNILSLINIIPNILSPIIVKYNINPFDISLIKIDINEESILEGIYHLSIKYKIPLYVSFNYIEWKNKNLHRFIFLTENQIDIIINNPKISILFNTFK